MRHPPDSWYIRFPDGRVLRAADTSVVRQQLAAGRLPDGTRLRRSRDEEWRSFERYPEFADLTSGQPSNGASRAGVGFDRRATPRGQPPATIASRLDASALGTPGVRGMLEELLAALESTAVRRKLIAAALAGALLGALAGVALLIPVSFSLNPPGAGWLLPLAGLVVFAWLTGVLSRMTFVELSRLRPARWSDGLRRIGPLVVRLFGVYALGSLLVSAAIIGLRWLPGWLLGLGAEGALGWAIGAQAAAALGVALEAALWPAFVLLLPVAALLVVEECGTWTALVGWCRLVRQHLGRLLLGEGLAVAVGVVISTPLALLAALVATAPVDPQFALAVGLARAVLAGMAVSVFLSYLVVANVFLYLKLRYQSG